MGDVVQINGQPPGRPPLSQHPEAIRARARRAAKKKAAPARAGRGAKKPPGTKGARPAPQPGAHEQHPAVIALLFMLCAAAAAGTFVMASGTLADMYPGIGAAVRALGLVGAECVFGHGAYSLIRARRLGPALACLAIVLLCAAAEMGLASMQGALAMRHRQEAVLLTEAPSAAPVPAALTVDFSGGPKKAAEILAAQAQARHEAEAAEERREAELARLRQERLKLATQQTVLERVLPVILALLCALASAATTPLLEVLIRLLKRREVQP